MRSDWATYTLLEVLYRRHEERLAHDHPQVLALLSYHMIGMAEGFNSLKLLREQGVRLWIWAETDVLNVYRPIELIERTGTDSWLWTDREVASRLPSFQSVYIPVLSFSLMSDILALNDRRSAVRFVLEALFSGKTVSALSVGADPAHPAWEEKRWDRGAPLLQLEIRRKLNQLRSFGIHLVQDNPSDVFLGHRKNVLTERDVAFAHKEGRQAVRVSKGDLVTPLAADYARAHGIRMIRQ